MAFVCCREKAVPLMRGSMINLDGQAFRKANSYLRGQVVQTDGGGICQIST